MSATCRECGSTHTRIIGENSIGRPVWECPNGHTQAGPFLESVSE